MIIVIIINKGAREKSACVTRVSFGFLHTYCFIMNTYSADLVVVVAFFQERNKVFEEQKLSNNNNSNRTNVFITTHAGASYETSEDRYNERSLHFFYSKIYSLLLLLIRRS